MLHRVSPVCAEQFAWVAELQRCLLEAVCSDNVTAAQVTPDWLYTKLIDVDRQWFDRFLQQKDKVRGKGRGQAVIENLRLIAGASIQEKQRILAIYQNNREIATLYTDTSDSEHPKKHSLLPPAHLSRTHSSLPLIGRG